MIKLPEPVELNPSANSVVGHSDATLKQAVRDFGEQCAQACGAEAEGRGAEDAFIAKLCAAAIRALIKEIV